MTPICTIQHPDEQQLALWNRILQALPDTSDHFLNFNEDVGNVVLAYANSTPLAGMEFDTRFAPFLQIWRLYTLPHHRGKGIGAALLDYSVHVARESGCHTIALSSSPDAVEFYERYGFVRQHPTNYILMFYTIPEVERS